MHLRRSRYVGLAQTHLHHVLTAASMNLSRLECWLAGTPRERTRQSAHGLVSRSLMTSPAVSRTGQSQIESYHRVIPEDQLFTGKGLTVAHRAHGSMARHAN